MLIKLRLITSDYIIVNHVRTILKPHIDKNEFSILFLTNKYLSLSLSLSSFPVTSTWYQSLGKSRFSILFLFNSMILFILFFNSCFTSRFNSRFKSGPFWIFQKNLSNQDLQKLHFCNNGGFLCVSSFWCLQHRHYQARRQQLPHMAFSDVVSSPRSWTSSLCGWLSSLSILVRSWWRRSSLSLNRLWRLDGTRFVGKLIFLYLP